jgi:hypothetical protein
LQTDINSFGDCDMPDECPDADTLARIAKSATAQVWAAAAAAGDLLPVWRDNRVVYVDPVTGQVVRVEDRPGESVEATPELPAVLRNLV